jgi:ABC-type lipoprotein release transport system permease subunit
VEVGGVVTYRLQSELRRRWRRALALALLVAVLGGIVLATAAGARRTSSAYDRLLEVANPPELLVSPSGGPGSDPSAFYAALARLPEVHRMRLFAGVPLVPEAGTPSERLAEALTGIGVVAATDGTPGSEIGRPKLLAGRLPDAARADEVLISQRFAAAGDLHVGDHIDAVLLTRAMPDEVDPTVATPEQGAPIRLTVTGIGVLYDEVVPFSDLNQSGSILATPPLAALVDRARWNFEGAFIDAVPGTDLDALTSTIEDMGGHEDLGTGGSVFVSDEASAAHQVSDAMQPLAVALGIAALVIGVVVLVVVGQAVSRSSRELPDDVRALRALGSQPGDRVGFATARAAVVGVCGAVGAVVVAVALSGWFPVGVARVAEPSPGVQVDVGVLAVGAVLLVILAVGSALCGALLDQRKRPGQPRPSRLAGAAAASGLSPAAVQGVRFSVLRGGSNTIPARSTLVAVTAAVTAVFATIAFADSLVALIDTPRRYGQGWDRMVDAQFGPAPVQRVMKRFATVPNVRGIGVGNYGDISVNSLPVPGFDLQAVHGSISVSILEGRTSMAADEIVLGSETIERLGVKVGDRVDVDLGDGVRRMLLTGRGVFPRMGQGSFSTTGLGIGAQLAGGTLASFGDFETVPPDYELDGRRYNFVVIDLAGSPAALDQELAELEASAVADGAFIFVRHNQPPGRIRDLERVRLVPAAMAGVLAVVALAALSHLLLTSVRERRRELALLRTLGFTNRQLRATVSWHASVVALAALAVGTPLGIALGRSVWRWFAQDLDVAAPPQTAWLWLIVTVVATVILANLVAAVPGRSAARTRPAVALRDE